MGKDFAMYKIRQKLFLNVFVIIIYSHLSVTTLASESEVSGAEIAFSIPQGISLQEALHQFSRQSNILVQANDSLVNGLVSGGFKGTGNANMVLTRLLAGTTLTWQTVSTHELKIIPVDITSNQNGAGETLGVVNVEGQNLQPDSATATGVNGSSDITATEGSGSLNGSMASAGDGTAVNVKDMAKSISVISHKQMTEQNSTTLSDVLSRAPGITVVQNGGNIGNSFYSRGFALTQATVDGGTTMDISNGGNIYGFSNDLSSAIYDHVEVLRGDSLLGGVSSTGGVSGSVNLVRKRPTDHFQLIYSGAAGSWNKYQNMLDVAGPLNATGTLRGRSVLSWQKQDYFYHYANRDDRTIYNILEFNATPSTLLTAGVNYRRLHATPWISGLSMYNDGTDPKFSRNTSFTQPWAYNNTETKEFFIGWDQKVAEHWALKTNYDGTYSQFGNQMITTAGGIDPDTGNFSAINGSASRGKNRVNSWDTKLSGNYDIGGLTQKFTFGGNYTKSFNDYTIPSPGYSPYYGILGNTSPGLSPFDWHAIPLGPIDPQNYGLLSAIDSTVWNVFGNAIITPVNRLHLGIGIRLDGYKTFTRSINSERTGLIESNTRLRKWEKPVYTISYDLSDEWSLFGDYSYVFTPQLTSLDKQGVPLVPQQGVNMEAGLKYGRPDGTLNASVSFYKTRLSNTGITINDPDYNQNGMQGYYWDVNPNEKIVKGIDSEISGSLAAGWQLMASYNYLTSFNPPSSTDGNATTVNTYTPKHMIRVWTDYNFVNGSEQMKKITIGGGVIAQSKTQSRVDTYYVPTFTVKQPFYAVYSAHIGYKVTDNWNIDFLVNNVFDKKYYSTTGNDYGTFGYFYGTPRNYVLSLTGTFE